MEECVIGFRLGLKRVRLVTRSWALLQKQVYQEFAMSTSVCVFHTASLTFYHMTRRCLDLFFSYNPILKLFFTNLDFSILFCL